MRRFLSDALITVGAVTLLLLALVIFDDRVREQVSLAIHGGAKSELVGASAQLGEIVTMVLGVARDQSIEHAPLMIFALAATVLVLFMLRT